MNSIFTVTDQISVEKILSLSGMPLSDITIVKDVLSDFDSYSSIESAVQTLLSTSMTLNIIGEEARSYLNIPSDGRSTMFFVWKSSLQGNAAFVGFDLNQIRSVVLKGFRLLELPTDRWNDMYLPEEVNLRLNTAVDQPSFSSHYILSAADHMAQHILNLASEIPGSITRDNCVYFSSSCRSSTSAKLTEWLSLPGIGHMASFVHVFMGEEM